MQRRSPPTPPPAPLPARCLRPWGCTTRSASGGWWSSTRRAGSTCPGAHTHKHARRRMQAAREAHTGATPAGHAPRCPHGPARCGRPPTHPATALLAPRRARPLAPLRRRVAQSILDENTRAKVVLDFDKARTLRELERVFGTGKVRGVGGRGRRVRVAGRQTPGAASMGGPPPPMGTRCAARRALQRVQLSVRLASRHCWMPAPSQSGARQPGRHLHGAHQREPRDGAPAHIRGRPSRGRQRRRGRRRRKSRQRRQRS